MKSEYSIIVRGLEVSEFDLLLSTIVQHKFMKCFSRLNHGQALQHVMVPQVYVESILQILANSSLALILS